MKETDVFVAGTRRWLPTVHEIELILFILCFLHVHAQTSLFCLPDIFTAPMLPCVKTTQLGWTEEVRREFLSIWYYRFMLVESKIHFPTVSSHLFVVICVNFEWTWHFPPVGSADVKLKALHVELGNHFSSLGKSRMESSFMTFKFALKMTVPASPIFCMTWLLWHYGENWLCLRLETCLIMDYHKCSNMILNLHYFPSLLM